jgi:hypothetical protein
MNSQFGNVEESLSPIQNSSPAATSGQDEKRASVPVRTWSNAMVQLCWWEAGWFKDWERVANGS